VGIIVRRSFSINHYDYLSLGGRDLEREKFTRTQTLSL
jgi:hypothetical protein